MDSQIVANRPGDPPRPPTWAPAVPPPPPVPSAWPPPSVTPNPSHAARKPLTLPSWLKASAIGFGVFFGLSVLGSMIPGVPASAAGLVGWIAGALLGSYAVGLRYLWAYVLVAAGVFLAVIAFDIVILSLVAV